MNNDLNADNRWLLVTDVDNTLTGDDAALREFVEIHRQLPNLLLALNSSRPAASVIQTLAHLPDDLRPDAMITAMGTQITIAGPDVHWEQRFESFDRAPIDALMRQLGFARHDEQFQTPYKASYEVPQVAAQAAQAAIALAVERFGMDVQIIRSGESEFDVIRANAGKGAASIYLAEQWSVLPKRLIVAGDSANDLSMFKVAAKGIVVGNARDELRGAVDPQFTHFASASFAAGIIEGLEHWGALPAESTIKE